MMTITKCFSIRASHQLTSLPHRKVEIGELCDILHGHEYLIEIQLSGDLDPKTGLFKSRNHLFQNIEDQVIEPLKGQHLNQHLKFTSGEYLAKHIFEVIKNKIPDISLQSVAIQETSKNRFIYSNRN